MQRRTRIALLACTGASLAGVPAHVHTQDPDVDTCQPTYAILARDATLVGAHGRYGLGLVTRTGEQTVRGVLVLVQSPPGREVLGAAAHHCKERWTSTSTRSAPDGSAM